MNKHLEILKIVATYVSFGFCWIYFSDNAVEWLIHDPKLATQISIYKGFLFIAITSVILYSLIAHFTDSISRSVKALHQSEERLKLLIRNTSDALVILDEDGSQRYVSPAAERITGFPASELEGKKIEEIIHPDDLPNIRNAWKEAVGHPERAVIVQYRHVHKTREWVFSEAAAQSFFDEPAINGIIASVRDITERKQAEEALTLTNKLLHTIIDTAPIRIFFKDRNFRFMGCNKAFVADAGVDCPEDLIGKDDYQLVWKEQADMYRADDRQVIETGQPKLSFDERQTTPDGRLVWVRTSKVPLRNEANEIIGVLGMYEDITDRKRVESELRESEDKFSQTFMASPDSININRVEDGLYVDINDGFTRLSGYTREDAIGKTSLELEIWHDPEDRKKLIREIREKGYSENMEALFRKKDGSVITGLMSARVIMLKGVPHLVSITRDITERKTHEKEQIKLEKLESLGILAGGIAHDFNNILTGIMGNISFAKIFLDPAHKAFAPLIEAEKAAGRAGELAHQLLTFAKGGKPVKRIVPVRHVVDEAASFILRGSNVKGAIDFPDNIHAVEADEGQLGQVMQNLIINATQAMPGGGVLTISGRNETLQAGNRLSLPPGPYVRIAIADQGCGIAQDDLKNIFDPYFTTKSAGVGLGLSSAHSIILNHGGLIEVDSRIGEGTTFIIHLPSIGIPYTDYRPESYEKAVGSHTGGPILIMDDDQAIRDIASAILTHLGYTVTTCADGGEAIRLYAEAVEAGKPYLACFMDLTIPGGLGGKETAQRLRSLFPDACLVVSSGYSNDPVMADFEKFGFRGAIAKPYTTQEVARVINAAVTGR